MILARALGCRCEELLEISEQLSMKSWAVQSLKNIFVLYIYSSTHSLYHSGNGKKAAPGKRRCTFRGADWDSQLLFRQIPFEVPLLCAGNRGISHVQCISYRSGKHSRRHSVWRENERKEKNCDRVGARSAVPVGDGVKLILPRPQFAICTKNMQYIC